jgi:competence ComEA-like helix-hairpin-helix protein
MKQLPFERRIRTRPVWLITGAALILAAGIGSRASALQGQGTKPARPEPAAEKSIGDLSPAEEEGFVQAAEQTIERVCIQCHPFENIIRTRRTVPEWNDQVTAMAGRGAPGTDRDFATIKRYLTRYYGVVRVNSASADELCAVLGLSSKDAAAIVAYRNAHGRFTDLAALSKVDGLDRTKLEEQPEALRFD